MSNLNIKSRLTDDSIVISVIDGETLNVIKKIESCHQKAVYKMALSGCSTRLATGSGDTVVRLWHIGPKEGFTSSCRLHNSIITLLRFHPTLPYLFSSSMGDTFIGVWDSNTGTHISSLEDHQSNVTGIDFSPDTKLIATHDKVIIIWSCPGFQRQSLIPAFESLDSCVFLPIDALTNHLGHLFSESDEYLLLTGGQWGCLRVWNPNDGRCVLEIKGPLDRRPLLSTDSNSSHSNTSEHHLVEYGLHSIVDLKIVNIHTHSDSPDCDSNLMDEDKSYPKLLLLRQSNHVEFYDPMIAKLTSEFLGDIGQVDQLCIAGKNSNFLILADASPHLKLFLNPYGLGSVQTNEKMGSNEDEVHSWKCHLIPGGHTDVIMDLTVSKCGQWIASASKDQSICLWQLVESDDQSKIKQSSDAKVQLIAHLKDAHPAHITALCFDKLTSRLVSCSEDSVLKVWNINLSNAHCSDSVLNEWIVMHGAHNDTISAIDVSVNNQLVATASRDKTIKIWGFGKSGLQCQGVLQGHRRGVWSVSFSTREKIVLTASADGDVKLWNLKDFSCIKTLEGHGQPVYKAVFLSEDKQVLSCDQKGLVRLWDVGKSSSKSKKPDDLVNKSELGETNSRVFEAHEGRIWSLVVCPNENGFFTGGEDETLCYFQDVSEQLHEESAKKCEEFIQSQQLLDNFLHEQKYPEALCLAVQLDQPRRTLDILQEIFLMDPNESNSRDWEQSDQSNSVFPFQVGRLNNILDRFIETQTKLKSNFKFGKQMDSKLFVQRFVSYVINWNTRSRTSLIGQCVLNWVLTRWSPQELIKWPNFDRTIESIIPYTNRHYQRVCRLEEQLSILDYLAELNDQRLTNEITDWDVIDSDVPTKLSTIKY